MAVTLDTLYLPVRELSSLIEAKKLTSEELTEACLGRLEKVGPKLGAVVTVMREAALKEARAADAEIKAGRHRGPLHGIPYGAKDLLAARGAPTTWGVAAYKDRVFDFDAVVVKRLREAGAVLAAKLAMVELAGSFGYESADNCLTGPCVTPWNTDYWAGGSSSGSGAAVAAGLVPFAIGSETNGSIVTPASYCGVTGLRPTYGRVSRDGAMPLSWTLDKIGPMGRTAEDCALVLSAISAKPFVWPGKAGMKKPRVGILRGATALVEKEVAANFRAAVDVLAKWCDVDKEVALPALPYGPVLSIILGAEGASALRDVWESGDALKLKSTNMRVGGFAAQATLATDYLDALRARRRIRAALAAVYAKYDAVIAPGQARAGLSARAPFAKSIKAESSGPDISALTTATNLAGYPMICVPSGSGHDGLRTSLQLTGRPGGEATLVSIAAAYQHATRHHLERPPA